MQTAAEPVPLTEVAETRQPEHRSARKHIRGSSLLLAGRGLSKSVNFLSQLVIVRYLSQTEFGAFAYALAMAHPLQILVTCGLDRAITRFLPIYQEREDYARVLGTLLMVLGTICSLGLAAVVAVYAFHGALDERLVRDELALSLLLVLVFLAPVQAIDDVLAGLFAVFAGARAIFFRKHVLAPALRLGVVLLLVLAGGSAMFLAVGYLAASVIGVAIYMGMVVRLLRRQGMLSQFRLTSVLVPWREVFGFTLPLLSSDLVFALLATATVALLQYFEGAAEVAGLRAVQPLAMMNQAVMMSFTTLFVPAAARLFARQDRVGINGLYWQTTAWIAVASFPLFAVCLALAEPLTVWLYGARYADSAAILAVLALGYYLNAALGLNGMTLKVCGHVRYMVAINVAVVIINLPIAALLIYRYGALGGAVGTCLTLILHNVLKQTGLWLKTGVRLLDDRYTVLYSTITICTLILSAAVWLAGIPHFLALLLVGAASAVVVFANREVLDVRETFPELLRFAPARWLLGGKGGPR